MSIRAQLRVESRGVNDQTGQMQQWLEHLPQGVAVVITIAGWLLALYLAIAWLLLPVYVIRRLTQIRDVLKEVRDNADAAESKRAIEKYRARAQV
jgi:hypothetical protein